jgi:hypothetical protein
MTRSAGWMIAAGALAGSVWIGGAQVRPDAAVAETCELCGEILPAPVVPLTAEHLESLARADARFNQVRIARIDAALAAGTFGAPNSQPARQTAHALTRIATVNNYRYLARLAGDQRHVYEAGVAALETVTRDFSDVSLVSVLRLRRMRLGLGRGCLQYDLAVGQAGASVIGGKPVRYRVRDEYLAGRTRRVMSLEMASSSSQVVEVLLGEHYAFSVEQRHSDGPPAPYDWFLVRDIRGAWLRRWGTHQPTAFMFWSSPIAPDAVVLPRTPLVGVRVYIPNLKLRLPVLPDINVDDLREVDLPQPILDMRYLVERRHPAWLATDNQLGFRGWKGIGGVPPGIREAFPDW